MKQKINISIVGGGASAVIFLRYLIQNSLKQTKCTFNVTIFEPTENIGVGLAYQDDLEDIGVYVPRKIFGT